MSVTQNDVAVVAEAPAAPLAADPQKTWSRTIRNRSFLALFIAVTIAVLVLIQPFVYVLFAATVTVIVTWPIFEAIRARVRGNRVVAALLSTLLLAVAVGAPVTFFVFLFVQQALGVVAQGVAFVNEGHLNEWIVWYSANEHGELLAAWAPAWAVPYLEQVVPADANYQDFIGGPVQSGSLAVLGAFGSFVPTLLNSTITASVGALVYVLGLIGLYMEGPSLLGVARNLSPIDPRYERKLFEVFRQLCNNMVLGALAIAVLQGIVAGIGYAIFGVERAVFFAILTGALSFVPMIGSALVWVPLSILVAATEGLGWGIGLAVWSMLCTSQIDNIVRPLIMRNGSRIHPMFIGLAAFGGISWLGVPGALIGPVIAALFLALYTIYVDDFLVDTALEPA